MQNTIPDTPLADFVLAAEATEHPELRAFFRKPTSVTWWLRTLETNGMKPCVVWFAKRPYIHVPTFTRILLETAGARRRTQGPIASEQSAA